jgi:hypothetical protein
VTISVANLMEKKELGMSGSDENVISKLAFNKLARRVKRPERAQDEIQCDSKRHLQNKRTEE